MFSNKNKVIEEIQSFISDYINKSNKKNLLIYGVKDLSDWFTVKVAEGARQQSGSEIFWIKDSDINLNFDLAKQISLPEENTREEVIKFCEVNSCIILSSLIRNKAIIHRYFHKHNNIADLYPILDLYFSEIYDLSVYLGIDKNNLKSLLNQNINLYSQEYEYCYKEDEKNNIISNDELPIRNKDWFKYTKSQKELIARLHQREKITRHKDLILTNPQYPKIRHIT